MNKQEAIEKINESRLAFAAILSRRNGKRPYFEKEVVVMKVKDLVDIINQIDDPEKPVIPQLVAEWIETYKKQGKTLYTTMDAVHYSNHPCKDWFESNQETFAHAWLYGYEVKKEKLYTARLKINGKERDSYINRVIESGEIYLSNLTSIEGKLQVHFTQTELKELHYWNNPAFEIEEVSNE